MYEFDTLPEGAPYATALDVRVGAEVPQLGAGEGPAGGGAPCVAAGGFFSGLEAFTDLYGRRSHVRCVCGEEYV